MRIINRHQRVLNVPPAAAGRLIDSLSSKEDALWPVYSWPRLKLDSPLREGAKGGHTPIGYYVEEYSPGRLVRFRFTRPKGFDGFHSYEVIEEKSGATLLQHTLEMKLRGSAYFTWPILFRPLHDALIEDSLARAEKSLGMTPTLRKWSLWVKFLRWVVSGGKSRNQIL